MNDLRECTFETIKKITVENGHPEFRAKQLFDWVHNKQITDLTKSSNLSQAYRDLWSDLGYAIFAPVCLQHQVSRDGTEKFLLQMEDGECIECVLMKYRGDYSKQRNTLCVSSQVGCKMGCSFCATGNRGFTRNLTAAEIVSQVYFVNHHLKAAHEKMTVRNIVFMGMGEPFDNFDAVMKAIELLRDPRGADIGQRRITISTCGLVPGIERFTDYGSEIGLAISLHAANNQDRSRLMPVNRTFPLENLIHACHTYTDKTHRRISFEYALITGVNDRNKDLNDLRSLLRGLDCHINVIPVNAVDHQAGYKKPAMSATRKFVDKLNTLGIQSSVREEKGADIDAACGQLKAKYETP